MEAELRSFELNLLAGRVSDTLAKLIEDREAEKRAVQNKRSAKRTIQPNLAPISDQELEALFSVKVADLQTSLDDQEVRLGAIGVIQALVTRIAIYPEGDGVEAEVELGPAHAMSLAATKAPAHQLGALRSFITVVAGVRFGRCRTWVRL